MSKQIEEVMQLLTAATCAGIDYGAAEEGVIARNCLAVLHKAEAAVDAKLRELLPEWQTIDTAPKDGTKILAWNSEYGARETKSETYGEGSIGFSEGRTDRWWQWLEPKNNWSLKWSPTHWMPLPAPPNQEGAT